VTKKPVEPPRKVPDEVSASEPLTPADDDLAQLEGSLDANPKWQGLLRQLGAEYFKRGYFKRALFAFGVLGTLEPPASADLVGLARSAIQLGEHTQAIEALMGVLEAEDTNDGTRAWARQKVRDMVATADASKVSSEGPAPFDVEPVPEAPPRQREAFVQALEKLGIVSFHSLANAEQIDGVRQKLEADPDNPVLLDWYAFLLYSNKRLPECVQVYERLAATDDPPTNSLYYLGNAYLKMSDMPNALRCWKRLKQEDPDNPLVEKVSRKLQKLYALRSKVIGDKPPPSDKQFDFTFTDYDKCDGSGLDEFEMLLAREPERPEVLDWAAFAYYTAGRYDQALDLYRRLLQVKDDSPQAYYYIGNIHCRTGRYDDAVKYWATLLHRFPEHELVNRARDKYDVLARALGA